MAHPRYYNPRWFYNGFFLSYMFLFTVFFIFMDEWVKSEWGYPPEKKVFSSVVFIRGRSSNILTFCAAMTEIAIIFSVLCIFKYNPGKTNDKFITSQ